MLDIIRDSIFYIPLICGIIFPPPLGITTRKGLAHARQVSREPYKPLIPRSFVILIACIFLNASGVDYSELQEAKI